MSSGCIVIPSDLVMAYIPFLFFVHLISGKMTPEYPRHESMNENSQVLYIKGINRCANYIA